MTDYQPYRLGWCKSYDEEVEKFRHLILCNPIDVDLLKDEYYELTGKRFRRKKDE
jgi:hydroxyacyl-ACP dehydratase HTD2-like protein with hotdog domain